MIISHKHDFFQQGIRIETPQVAIPSKLLRMAFDIIIYYPSEERMLNSKNNQSKENVIIYIIFSLNNIITITYYILCFQQMYKEGLGSVYHSWYLPSKFFDWHFFHPSEKNILNQYIFVDDLVSNIFQIKKSVCWRYRI